MENVTVVLIAVESERAQRNNLAQNGDYLQDILNSAKFNRM
jgi:hypothetical protein